MAYNNVIYSTGTATYKDLDISMKPNPGTGDLRVVSDVEAIRQSLTVLLSTNFGERPFRPRIGGNLTNVLFEPLDSIELGLLQSSIASTIINYESRVNIIGLSVVQDATDPTTVDITLTFSMVNVSAPQTINILLTRRR